MGVRALAGLSGGHRYLDASTALTVYTTPTWWRDLTLAVRGGGRHLVGTFPFYDAATIGGSSTLRGYRADRFAGRTAVFGGIEPRLSLGRLSLPLLSGETGVLAFADAGRVWSSAGGTGIRYGYGGGLFFVVSGLTAVTATYEASADGGAVVLRLGFGM
jgi:outer membrane protein assembly factor BamA